MTDVEAKALRGFCAGGGLGKIRRQQVVLMKNEIRIGHGEAT